MHLQPWILIGLGSLCWLLGRWGGWRASQAPGGIPDDATAAGMVQAAAAGAEPAAYEVQPQNHAAMPRYYAAK